MFIDNESSHEECDDLRMYEKKYSQMTKEEVVKRAAMLEIEFNSFQAESKDLEDFMEADLTSATEHIRELEKQVQERDQSIRELSDKLFSFKREIKKYQSAQNMITEEQKAKQDEMSKQLVELEVQNDNLRSGIREKLNELKTVIEKSNSFLENIAVLQNDVTIKDEMLEKIKEYAHNLENLINQKSEENENLQHKITRLERLLQITVVDRRSFKVSKYKTPPVKYT